MREPLLDHGAVAVVDVAGLLAEAERRIGVHGAGEAAGSLAVVEVRAPHPVGPEQIDAMFGEVGEAAVRLDAWLAFDDERGSYLLLLPVTAPETATAVLGELLHRLAATAVPCGRRTLRPSVGAGVVELTGLSSSGRAGGSAPVDGAERAAALDGAGKVDRVRAEAVVLAHRSIVERALRVHGSPSHGDGNRRPVRERGLRRRYLGLSASRKAWVLVASNLVIAWVIPLLLYSALYLAFGLDVSNVGFWIVLGAVVVTALTVYAEAVLALRPMSLPGQELSSYPPASAIVVAYLPNETSTIVDTLHCLLHQDYPGSFEVVLAYNTPRRLAIERDLVRLAAGDSRLVLVRVGDSTSKAQNINAALQVTHGEVIGIFDADHRPMASAFRRAARWLDNGADVVQGRSVVRNGERNWLARMVAVEFEGIYAVAHPGRAALHAFGIFGGSNGFWRAEVLDRLRMRPDMLTEDIDISIRAVFDGCRIAVDPQLLSEELAPLTPMALWSQRIRWSHGWHQVSRLQIGRIWRTEALTVRQRLGASFLLGWREAYPWVAAQMIPILAFSLLVRHHVHVQWLGPIFLVTVVYVSAVGPVQALFAWRLSVPQLRRRRWWWWQYMLFTGILFGEFKALVNRAAHLRELLGDRAWQVTPRTTGQGAARAAGSIARLPTDRAVTELVTMGSVTGTTTSFQLDVALRRLPALDSGQPVRPSTSA